MKKLFALLLVSVMVLAFPTAARAATQPTVDYEKVIENGGVITPNTWYYSYSVTIPVYYSSLADVPDTYFYEEYNSGMGTYCSGYLTLDTVDRLSDGIYKAYFIGTIGAYIF